ncbi:MAG TPA: MBL fold metallo-hydrolase [Xanthobacteraceae bacterium]|nr:MBL fold metallo-hydrolase [Xanthobacteraceae bacterium]
MTYRYQGRKLCAAAAVWLVAGTQTQAAGTDADACRSLMPTAMGGPLLTDPGKIMLRWLSTSNYELVYRGQVFLLDAYFERGPRNRPTGIVPGEVKQVDAIFIGHGHFDHMSDAAPIAQKTGAKVIGAPITIETAYKLGVPEGQGTVVAGGETLKFKGVAVDAALAQHSTLSRDVLDTLGKLYDLDAGPATPQQAEAEKAILAKGTFAPDVITKGTIAYAFTFDTGYKLVWIDSAGPVTDGMRALAQKLGPVDIAIVAYQGHPVAQVQVPVTLELVKLFRPRTFMPAHHDQIFGTFVDLGVEPLFEAIEDALPGTQTIAPLHRRPNCFDISKKHGNQ